MKEPVHLYLYGEPAAPTLDLDQLASYVERLLSGLRLVVRESFVGFLMSQRDPQAHEDLLSHLAEEFARAKVRDPLGQKQGPPPLRGEVLYERRRLAATGSKTFGLLYDGFQLLSALRNLLPREERGLRHIHVVFTNQLVGTWDEGERRYHARAGIFGYPSLLSTTGVVEAPAKPREYYFLKQQYTALGMGDAAAAGLEREFQGRYVEHDDPRLTEVMKGYVMQAVLGHLLGEPFCEDRGCRLFNAHWQAELMQAQLDGDYEFCARHSAVLQQLRQKGAG